MESLFEKELTELINRYNKENDSDTPDFILARYLNAVLLNFNAAINDREQWYNRERHVDDMIEQMKDQIDSNNTGNSPSSDLPLSTSIDLDYLTPTNLQL
jgi:hypothetical protein